MLEETPSKDLILIKKNIYMYVKVLDFFNKKY